MHSSCACVRCVCAMHVCVCLHTSPPPHLTEHTVAHTCSRSGQKHGSAEEGTQVLFHQKLPHSTSGMLLTDSCCNVIWWAITWNKRIMCVLCVYVHVRVCCMCVWVHCVCACTGVSRHMPPLPTLFMPACCLCVFLFVCGVYTVCVCVRTHTPPHT